MDDSLSSIVPVFSDNRRFQETRFNLSNKCIDLATATKYSASNICLTTDDNRMSSVAVEIPCKS